MGSRTLASLLVVAPLALTAPAAAQTTSVGGGAPAPQGRTSLSPTGGTPAGTEAAPRPQRRERKRRPTPRGPALTLFELSTDQLFLYGAPATVRFRIERGSSAARVRLLVLRGRERVTTLDLGSRERRVTHVAELPSSGLAPGRYRLRLAARDERGRRLRRGGATAAAAAAALDVAVYGHTFPLIGPFDYGGEDARFGAPRKGHTHQGPDLSAVEGTPVVAPRGGTVEAIGYQRRAAGHYVVIDGDGEDRDYVFMHLREGSIAVAEGERVATGEPIGEVGSTGRSSGAHLHFEIWVGGWWADGGTPIDPLPLLRSWDRYS